MQLPLSLDFLPKSKYPFPIQTDAHTNTHLMDQRAPMCPGGESQSSHRGIAALWKMYDRIWYKAELTSTQLWIKHLVLRALSKPASGFKMFLSILSSSLTGWLSGFYRIGISLSVSLLLFFPPLFLFAPFSSAVPLSVHPAYLSVSFLNSSYDSVNTGPIILPFQKSDCQPASGLKYHQYLIKWLSF